MVLRPALAALILLAAPLVARAAIVIERPEVRASAGGQPTTAAYMVVRNTGRAPDALVGAACACADSVMAHQTTTVNGVAHMAMEMRVLIPAKGSVAFAPGGRHLMLTGLKAPIAPGSHIPIRLQFERAGTVTTRFTAVSAPATG